MQLDTAVHVVRRLTELLADIFMGENVPELGQACGDKYVCGGCDVSWCARDARHARPLW